MRSGRAHGRETIQLSSLTGMGRLLKNGCTSVFDHHYVFRRMPETCWRGAGAGCQAAWGCGAFFPAHGSFEKDGGLPRTQSCRMSMRSYSERDSIGRITTRRSSPCAG